MALLVAFVGMHLAILFAGFFAPVDPAKQDRELSYAPPTKIHFSCSSALHCRPYVHDSEWTADGYREGQTQYPLHFLVRGDSYRMLWSLHSNVHLFGVDVPGRIFLLGTDRYGRDVFSRLIYGGQISLAAGVLATFISLALATLIGIVSGYYGGWIDEWLMGSSELFLSLPWLYFLIGVRAFLPLHVSAGNTFLLLIAVIGTIGWARPARLVRGIALSARTRNYVLAARGFGGSDLYILRRHILPELYGIVLTQAALLIPQYVAAEATLSFFGLGIGEPVASWGNMLSALQQYSVLISYYWLLAPAATLVITSVIYWLVADKIHDWLQSHSS